MVLRRLFRSTLGGEIAKSTSVSSKGKNGITSGHFCVHRLNFGFCQGNPWDLAVEHKLSNSGEKMSQAVEVQ